MARWKYVILRPVYVALQLRLLTSSNTKKSYCHFLLYTGHYCVRKTLCLTQDLKLPMHMLPSAATLIQFSRHEDGGNMFLLNVRTNAIFTDYYYYYYYY